MNTPTPIPWPKDPRHQRLADLIFSGVSTTDAMDELFPKAKKSSRSPMAGSIKRRKDYKAYLAYLRSQSNTDAVMSAQEKREYFARVKRTPVTKLDPENPDDPNGDLIKSYAITETETSCNVRIEKFDTLKAIELDNQLSGDDPESDFFRSLNEAIAQLSSPSPIPSDEL